MTNDEGRLKKLRRGAGAKLAGSHRAEAAGLEREFGELTAIAVASVKTARKRLRQLP
jgi:hypothetical protein